MFGNTPHHLSTENSKMHQEALLNNPKKIGTQKDKITGETQSKRESDSCMKNTFSKAIQQASRILRSPEYPFSDSICLFIPQTFCRCMQQVVWAISILILVCGDSGEAQFQVRGQLSVSSRSSGSAGIWPWRILAIFCHAVRSLGGSNYGGPSLNHSPFIHMWSLVPWDTLQRSEWFVR